MINQIEKPTHIPTNMLNLTMVGIRFNINLTFFFHLTFLTFFSLDILSFIQHGPEVALILLVIIWLMHTDGLNHFLKVINQVEDPDYIFTNILNLTLVGIRCEINLIFLKYYISPTSMRFCHRNSFVWLLTYYHLSNTVLSLLWYHL